MKTEEHTLPAYWASALVNGDFSGLDEREEQRVRQWLSEHPDLSCLTIVEEEAFFACFDGFGMDCLTYVFSTP